MTGGGATVGTHSEQDRVVQEWLNADYDVDKKISSDIIASELAHIDSKMIDDVLNFKADLEHQTSPIASE